jgi:hypothetical protein
MLTQISDILFPDRCEIIEISNMYIYPIYKNGSSSLYTQAKENYCKRLLNEQIKKIEIIDVVLRDPLDRFISGINAFVFFAKREHSDLDIRTIIYFAENYLFLNRHYAPQIFWLLNLSRYMNEKTKLRLRPMTDLVKFTNHSINFKTTEDFLLSADDVARLKDNIHNKLYLNLDKLLLDLIGQVLTFDEILTYIKEKDPVAFKRISCVAPD